MSETVAPADSLPPTGPIDKQTAPPLGRIAAGGFAWSFGFTLLSKFAGMAGQIVLARLLVPDDYGLVSLAYTTAILPNVLRDAGTIQILVQRRNQFNELANAAFWMSLCLGLVAGLMIAVSAPIAAHLYGAPQIIGLSLVLALTSPINSLTIVPGAKMQIDLRIRLLSGIFAATPILTTILSIFFAWLGWGAYGLILPILIVALLRLPIFWIMSPYPVRMKLEVSKWKPFLFDGSLLLGTSLCWAVVAQGDYAILGLFTDKDTVGFYFFAFSLSMQAVQMLSGALSGVLFPTLSRLKDEPERQRAAFIRAARLSAAITIPLALLPIACAKPLILLLFGEKWLPATPLLQILSVAAAMATLSAPTGSYLMATGRNKRIALYAFTMCIVFLVLVFLGTTFFSANGAAVAVAIFHGIALAVGMYLTLGPTLTTTLLIIHIAVRPLVLGLIAVFGTAAIVMSIPVTTHHNILAVAVAGSVLAILNLVLIRIVSPELFAELQSRLHGFKRNSQSSAPASGSGKM